MFLWRSFIDLGFNLNFSCLTDGAVLDLLTDRSHTEPGAQHKGLPRPAFPRPQLVLSRVSDGLFPSLYFLSPSHMCICFLSSAAPMRATVQHRSLWQTYECLGRVNHSFPASPPPHLLVATILASFREDGCFGELIHSLSFCAGSSHRAPCPQGPRPL